MNLLSLTYTNNTLTAEIGLPNKGGTLTFQPPKELQEKITQIITDAAIWRICESLRDKVSEPELELEDIPVIVTGERE